MKLLSDVIMVILLIACFTVVDVTVQNQQLEQKVIKSQSKYSFYIQRWLG